MVLRMQSESMVCNLEALTFNFSLIPRALYRSFQTVMMYNLNFGVIGKSNEVVTDNGLKLLL